MRGWGGEKKKSEYHGQEGLEREATEVIEHKGGICIASDAVGSVKIDPFPQRLLNQCAHVLSL